MDPSFDPLKQLEDAHHLIQQLIQHHNRHDALWQDLSAQHQQIIELIKTDRDRMTRIENKLNTISRLVQDLYDDDYNPN